MLREAPYTLTHTYTHTRAQALLRLTETFSIINDLIRERKGLNESGLYFSPGGRWGTMGSWPFMIS